MKNSKLINLLKTFNSQELREFKDFVASPFFNKNQELVLFFDYLKKAAPRFSNKKIDRFVMYSNLFPKQNFDEKHYHYLMSFLLKLAEKYLGYKKYHEEKLLPEYHLLASCIERNLEKHYQQNFQKISHASKTNKLRDTNFYYQQFLLADIANQHFLSQKIRKFDNRLQLASDYFDLYYLANKLKYSCEMLDRQQSLSAEYVVGMIDEVTQYLEKNDFEKEPAINIYYHILRILIDENPEPYFLKLKQMLFDHFDQFTKDEMQRMYFHTLNFCIRKIRKGEEKYVEESLNLYLKGIESTLLLENDLLSPWTYKNVVKLGLRLNRFEWTEGFIHQYNNVLSEEFRKDALQYNLADLYYYKNDLDKALEHLRNVEFSDIYYALDSKIMLLKIYSELKEEEPLLALLASFSIYLKRNKLISNKVRQTYLNFVKILHSLSKRKIKNLETIQSQILETELLTDRNWLLKRFNEIAKMKN